MTRSPAELEKALSICHAGNGCKYGTNPDCPYRITDASCDLAGLIADAANAISELQEECRQHIEAMNKAAAALGCDCENCDRW